MSFLGKAAAIGIGCLFISLGINLFLVPFEFLEGGALGISLIIHYILDVKVGLTFLLISIPIFIAAWFLYRPFFYNGIHGLLCSSVIIDMLTPLREVGFHEQMNPWVGAVAAGVCIGSGAGLMLRKDISIGGTDLLAQMVAKKLSCNPALMILCFDVFIVTIGTMLLSQARLGLSLTIVLTVGITASSIVAYRKK
ncbi:YitT family protein [Sporosarcina sp. Te-1]|uniref:YitT family protein n=1 Tax=Sporosarcina sp. Te-1 TaxID=2818390 RepID=UPI001A9D6538|nr:YitT family protein [Sporosarcina sp. Te-1]QTD41339.1 YitT family protein [Sporosarcina sp. Te-1]